MKFVVLGLLTFLFSHASFAQCVNVSGIYKMDDGTVQKLRQNSCIGLRVQYGKIGERGIEWFKPELSMFLDGRQSCQIGTCWKGNVDNDRVELSRDTLGLAYDSKHGACSYQAMTYSTRPQGGLVMRQNVFQCDDGYSGVLEKGLSPLN